MRTRFGLHTDIVLVGNMGAPDRMQYTCLGSGVNLAARIEGMNKLFGTQILVSEPVRRKASSDFLFRRVDIVEAKGTSIPVTVYELMGERSDASVLKVSKEEVNRASR
jgi:adenylate cyclase